MKKNGRPILEEIKKRIYSFEFRMNEEEIYKFNLNYESFLKENNLNKIQFTKTDFVKYFVLDKGKSKKIFAFNIGKLVNEINKIGKNINQITKKVNSFFVFDSQIEKQVEDVNTELLKIYKLLNKQF